MPLVPLQWLSILTKWKPTLKLLCKLRTNFSIRIKRMQRGGKLKRHTTFPNLMLSSCVGPYSEMTRFLASLDDSTYWVGSLSEQLVNLILFPPRSESSFFTLYVPFLSSIIFDCLILFTRSSDRTVCCWPFSACAYFSMKLEQWIYKTNRQLASFLLWSSPPLSLIYVMLG